MAKKNYRKVRKAGETNSAQRRQVRVPISDQPVKRDASLAFLAKVLAEEKQFERETRRAVQGARKRGATWDQIAKVMGLSIGATHDRYAESKSSKKRRVEGRKSVVIAAPTD